MKLVLCRVCQDVVRLFDEPRWCKCGECGGQYVDEDGLNALYWGRDAVPLGFSNPTLAEAVHRQPAGGMGEKFVAFVIPKRCDTFRKVCGKDIPKREME